MKHDTTVKLFPCSFDGSVKIPPSKSLSHRALICAALCKGETLISNFVYSEDTLATIGALESLGVKFEKKDKEVLVHGIKRLKLKSKEVYCNESGSTIRFIIPLFSLTGKEVHSGTNKLVDLSNVESGVYFVELISGKSRAVKRFMKN